ncbi:MAG: DNA polymerase III subunit beta [Prevotellaceae bacterium]|jgi:DNA polymerase-3 subunit beta|nr:DNA polymerase III subunit beta [Prevotellaceae bacterium]
MKFIVSSSELLSNLQSISKVISSKNTLPILDNFLFQLHNNKLKITASDLETTLVTTLTIENIEVEGDIAIPAKLLTDTLKEFADQPLTIIVNPSNLSVEISWSTGKFNIPGSNADDYPLVPELKKDTKVALQIDSSILMEAISKTYFATADDELRPVMNGIYFDIKTDEITFVASDAHKLVRYRRTDLQAPETSSFILPKKPASLLRNILGKENNPVQLEFDDKNASFSVTHFKMVCRLVEGIYPAYNSVIPIDNPNKVTIDRIDLLNCVRRVSVFSNQASNLIKLKIVGNELSISAQDLDFSISAIDRLNCQYDGEDMEIGFKSTFLIEILANLPSTNVNIELSDPGRAGLFLPFEKDDENEDILMLLMPMMIGL